MVKKSILLKAATLSMVLPMLLMSEAHANAKDIHEIIDVCTASERIMKDYALIGMGIVYHNPQKNLDETVKHLEAEMADLMSEKTGKKLHAEEEALIVEWHKIEENLTHTPIKQSALELHHHVNDFAKHCEILAEELAASSTNHAEHYVLLIERLNLNVQELAGIYTMKAWDAIGDDEYYPEVEEVLADYNKDYDELMVANDNMVSTKVKERLKTLKKHFMMFEMMTASHSGRYVPLLIAKKADKINDETESILEEEENEVEK